MKTTLRALSAAATLALALGVFQQTPLIAAEAGGTDGSMQGDAQEQMHLMVQPKGDQGPSSSAFAAANARMHDAMAITYTGDADIDFVRGMIPHHQGAIDMAKIVLAFGSDPEIKALAEGIVKAQEAEIAQMEAWLKKHGK